MRTTLDIDEDVLLALKTLSVQQGVSMGHVVSGLARQALTRKTRTTMRNGVPLFPARAGAGVASLDLVNRLRDEA